MRPASRPLRGALLCAGLLLAVPAQARDRDFNRIVDRLSEHYQQRPAWGMGFLCFLARCFMPSEAGVSHLKLALFEDVKTAKDENLDGFIEAAVEPRFTPFIKVRARNQERTWIYSREDGKNIELLLVNLEPREAVVMKMRLEPAAFAKWLEDPEGMARKTSK